MSVGERAFVALQHVLPLKAISQCVHALSRAESPALKSLLIGAFRALYRIDLTDAERGAAGDYRSFNDFFTRALKRDARPLDADPRALVSPVDATVSQAGRLEANRLVQAELGAKRHTYTLEALFASAELAAPFIGGSYACLYLAPADYHRVHAPVAGRLTGAWFVPGALYSVNAATARRIPGLYALNERIVLRFATRAGPLGLVMVGALNVGSMSLKDLGEIPGGGAARTLPAPERDYARGEELGRFNLGSTVILIVPPGGATLDAGLRPGVRLQMGGRLGRLE